jgi:hypothetical protein
MYITFQYTNIPRFRALFEDLEQHGEKRQQRKCWGKSGRSTVASHRGRGVPPPPRIHSHLQTQRTHRDRDAHQKVSGVQW